MIEAANFTPITFVDNEDFPVSFDSENKPYSKYSYKKWHFPNDNCVISFYGLDGHFEETAKRIALKIINTRSFRSTVNGNPILTHLPHKNGNLNLTHLSSFQLTATSAAGITPAVLFPFNR